MKSRFPRQAFAIILLAFAAGAWHGQELGAVPGLAPLVSVPLAPCSPLPRGTTKDLVVTVSGTAPFTFEWKRDNTVVRTNVTSQTSDTLHLVADYAIEGNYTVTVSNLHGTASSGPVTVDVIPGPPQEQGFIQPVEAFASPGDTAHLHLTVNGFKPMTFQWRKDGKNFGAPFTNSTGIGPLDLPMVPASNGTYSCVITNADGTTTSLPFHVGFWDKPAVRLLTPVLLTQNNYIDINSTVISKEDPVSFQWQFNGVNIPGATSQNLQRTAKNNTDLSGSYRVIMRTAHYAAVSNSITVVGVANNNPPVVIAQGGKTTITVPGARPGPTYLWRRGDGKPLSAHCTGVSTPTLTISNADLDADTATYHCLITTVGNNSNAVIGGNTYVTVVRAKPEFVGLTVATTGQVSIKWGMQLSATNSPTKFGASGLPPGVVINTRTGLVSGAPLKVGVYRVTFTATNPMGPTSAGPFTVTVSAQPSDANLSGTWVGPIHAVANGDGPSICSCSITITSVGTFTGRIYGLFGGTIVRTFGFSGAIGGNPDGTFDGPSAAFVVPKTIVPGSSGVATMNLRFSGGDLSADMNDLDPNVNIGAEFAGFRNPWSATTKPATSYVGPYTAELGFDLSRGVPIANVSGYAAFTVRADGTFTFAGKLPDGTAFSIPSFVDGTGSAWLKTTLYGGKGVLEDIMFLTLNTGPQFLDTPVSGILKYIRPGSPLTPVESITNPWFSEYNGSFTVIGSRYLPPGSGILGVGPLMMNAGATVAPTPNVSFKISGGDLAAETVLNARLDATHTLAFPAFAPGAEVKPTSLTFDPATGLFSGSFIHYLYDDVTHAVKSSHSTAIQGAVVRGDSTSPNGRAVGFHVTTETQTVHDQMTPTKAVIVTSPLPGTVSVELKQP